MVASLDFELLKHHLKPRPSDCNKGDFGKVVIVGGESGFSGAAILAAKAALRVGAGSVAVITRPEHAALLNSSCPELMCHGTEQSSIVKELLSAATLLIVGPGLGQNNWGRDLLEGVLATHKPTLLDADALNLIAHSKSLPSRRNWILTPHPGEAARLLQCSVAEVQKDRLCALERLFAIFGGTTVLKGAGTLVYTETHKAEICPKGNPGMATAGMGDVLSGVIGGLAAQGLSLEDASRLGILVHAMAGDLAALKGQRGLIASDLIAQLRVIINQQV